MKTSTLIQKFMKISGLLLLFLLSSQIANGQYCSVSSNCSMGDQIEDFSTTGATTNITNNSSGCSTNGYGDYTSTHTLVADLGSSFDISVQTQGSYPQGFTIWIDWNQDGDFSDAGEEVWNSGTSATTAFTGTINIPATASTGSTVMRVMAAYNTVPTDPCNIGSYGEAEDYGIQLNAPSCSHSVVLYDDYGDGWNGGSLDVLVNSTTVLSSLTISSGAGPETHTFTATQGDIISTSYTAGNWASENSYEILDGNGSVLATDGSGGATPIGLSGITANCISTSTAGIVPPYSQSWESSSVDDWSQVTYDDDNWSANSGSTSSSGTGPSGASDGTYYLYTETSGSSNGDVFVLESPEFDFSTSTVPTVMFDYHMLFDGELDGTLNLDISTDGGTTWTTAWTKTGEQGSSWQNAIIDLTSYASSSSVYMRFHFTTGTAGSSYDYDASIDNFQLINLSCPPPSNLTVDTVISNTATLSWTTGGASNWNIEYGPAGFTPGTGTLVTNVTNPYTLTGLALASGYDVYVQDSCGVGDVSPWIGPEYFFVPFSFSCTAGFTDTIFQEGWESGQGLWTGDIGTSNGEWQINSGSTGSSNTGPDGAHDGSYYIYYEASSSGIASMVSPPIDLSSGTGSAYFSYYMHAYGSDFANSDFSIGVSTSPTGPFYLELDTTFTGQAQSGHSDPYIQQVLDLTSYLGQTIYLEFTFDPSSTYEADLALDQMEVYTCVTCPAPYGLTVSNIQNTSADIDWTSSASQWLVEYGPSGFVPGSGDTMIVNSKPATLSNLNQATIYDVYVKDICSVGDTSATAGPLTFNTTTAPLCGSYSIGDTTGGASYDFPSFNRARDYLTIGGVSCPVTFQVASGTYNEQVSFDSIPGSSATNTVTFTSLTGDSTDVVLQYASTGTSDLHTVLLNNVDYLTFNQMTIKGSATDYGRVISMENLPQNITIQNCVIEAPVYSSSYSCPIYSINNPVHNLTIQNNHIIGGYYGIYMDGESSNNMTNFVVENNVIEDYYYYGVYTYYQFNAQIKNNILRNDAASSSSVYGIRAYYNDQTSITGNDINVAGTGTHYGIYFRGEGTSANPNLVANNLINLNGTGTSTWYGTYIYYNDTCNVFHNTINLNGGSSSSRALYYYYGDEITSKNNIASNYGGGYAVYSNNGSNVISSDYNVYYTTGSDLAYWSGAESTLADLQTANSMDANSTSADPVYANSSDDLTPLNGSIDNLGTPIPSITTDIFGNTRSATTPDAGAMEFTGLSADLALTDGELVNGQCLSANDSIYLSIDNLLITTADFATNNLVVNWSVTGPQNSTGSIVINSGTLMPNSTLIVGGDGVDMSVPGDYVLSAWIDPNPDNGFAGNDSILNYTTHTINSLLTVNPHYDTIYTPVDTVQLTTQSPFFPGGTVFLTEICHWAGTSTGEPTGGQPIYLGDDYVEITGVPNSDLSGYTFEKWAPTGSSPDVTHTFPAGTSFSPNGTYLLSTYQGSTSLADYHQVANTTDSYSSSSESINIIKDPSGTIVDVVVYETGSTIPAAAGVSPSDWTGPGIDGSSSWGIRLTGPDTDDNTNWVKADGSPQVQDPNVLNAGVTAPAPTSITGFTWSHQGSIVNNNVTDTVVGPFTSNGTYEYIASFNTPCGMVYDTARITVMAPTVTTSMGTIVSCNPGDSVDLVLDFTGTPPWDVQVTDGSDTLWIPNITTTPFTISDTPLVTTNYEALMVNDANGWNYGTANITAEVYNSPVISTSISPDPVNYGTPAMLDVTVSGSSSYSYAWTPADSLANPMNYNLQNPMTKNMSAPMTFSVIVTDDVTGCSSTGDVQVNIIGGPLNTFLSSNRDTVCQGDTTQLFSSTMGGSGNYTYSWSSVPPGFNSTNPNPVVTVDNQTTYFLTVNDGFNTKTESITISNWSIPSFTLSSNNGPSYVECASLDTLSAYPTGGLFYGTAVSGNTFYPSAAGTGMHMIHYDYVDPNGCHYLETMPLTVTPDITSPTVNTKNITVALNEYGQTSIDPNDINDGSFDNCGIAGYSIDQQYFTCADLGANTVVLTAYDDRGNSSTNTAQVTIVDNNPPTISTVNLPVFLDASGQAAVSAADVDNGTYDACGLDTIMISQNTFNCQNIGPNLITFTAMDLNGNTSSTPVVVTVYDNMAPVVTTQSTTTYLNAYGLATISPLDVDNGSSDNCAIMSMSLDNHMFTCSDLGTNSVNLTVTDVNMNSASSTAQVNVMDTMAPNVVTKDITVYLNNNGQAVISTSDINNGSTDNCGISSMSLSQYIYDCTDLGINLVTFTASDQSGNLNSSYANVTVVDTISPVITQMSDTIVCPGAFNFNTPTAIDNCSSTVTQTAGPDGGDILSGGVYTYSFVATDVSGNTAHTSFTVTVSEPDISLGQDISVCHSDTLTLSVTPGYNSYLWSTGEVTNAISLDSSSLGMGTHVVWVTVADSMGCTATDSINVTFQNCVGIHEFVSEGDITIYPNPTKGLFNLDIKGLKDESIQVCIYNFSGQKVVCKDIGRTFQNGYHKTFDLSHLPAGVYLLKLTGASINRVERIIIQ